MFFKIYNSFLYVQIGSALWTETLNMGHETIFVHVAGFMKIITMQLVLFLQLKYKGIQEKIVYELIHIQYICLSLGSELGLPGVTKITENRGTYNLFGSVSVPFFRISDLCNRNIE